MLKIIAAIGKNNELGINNGLPPWKLKTDMKRFKELTQNGTVVMGRKTFESLPEQFRPLPNRKNIVITRNISWNYPNIVTLSKTEELQQFPEIWVIGGSEIYKSLLHVADELHITHVDGEFPADAYFPFIDEDLWVPKHEEEVPADENNSHRTVYVVYRKI